MSQLTQNRFETVSTAGQFCGDYSADRLLSRAQAAVDSLSCLLDGRSPALSGLVNDDLLRDMLSAMSSRIHLATAECRKSCAV